MEPGGAGGALPSLGALPARNLWDPDPHRSGDTEGAARTKLFTASTVWPWTKCCPLWSWEGQLHRTAEESIQGK